MRQECAVLQPAGFVQRCAVLLWSRLALAVDICIPISQRANLPRRIITIPNSHYSVQRIKHIISAATSKLDRFPISQRIKGQ